ncbi:hypothetical protein niasHT_004356 [Heterodera trifolii]|uniref:Ubiquitin-like domain-containing protein n=1 Tax=Heterodera trifolii TaxID=157864 RepID=A0ABD2MBA9_9BILA
MKQFGLSLLSLGIPVGLMTMLLLLIMVPSSIDGNKIKITVTADEHIFKKLLIIKTNSITVKNEVKSYYVWVKREETVAILKKKIKNKSGIKPDDQILKCNAINGPELENEKPLTDYGIKNGTTFFLSSEFEVAVEYVQKIDFKNCTILAKRTDILATLKDMIMEQYTEEHKDCYEYGFTSIELVKEFITGNREPYVSRDDVELWPASWDHKTMKQCGISEGSIVYVYSARPLTKNEYDDGCYALLGERKKFPIKKKPEVLK